MNLKNLIYILNKYLDTTVQGRWISFPCRHGFFAYLYRVRVSSDVIFLRKQ